MAYRCCDQEFDNAGLFAIHQNNAHGLEPSKSKRIAASAEKGAPGMTTLTCPTCHQKDHRIEKLEDQVKALEGDRRRVEMPTVAAFVEHCDAGGECAHGKEWKTWQREFAGKVLGQASDDFIRSEALKRGILPETIRVGIS